MTVYGVLDAITSNPEVTSVALIGLALLGLVPALLTAAGATALVYLLLSVVFGPANVPEVSGQGPGKREMESGTLAMHTRAQRVSSERPRGRWTGSGEREPRACASGSCSGKGGGVLAGELGRWGRPGLRAPGAASCWGCCAARGLVLEVWEWACLRWLRWTSPWASRWANSSQALGRLPLPTRGRVGAMRWRASGRPVLGPGRLPSASWPLHHKPALTCFSLAVRQPAGEADAGQVR